MSLFLSSADRLPPVVEACLCLVGDMEANPFFDVLLFFMEFLFFYRPTESVSLMLEAYKWGKQKPPEGGSCRLFRYLF